MFLRASAVLAIRHTKAVLVTALVVAAFGAFFGAGAASRYTLVGLEDPGAGSSQANKLVERATGNEPLPGFIALFPTDAKPQKKATNANSAEPEIEQLTIALKIHRIEKEIKADPQVGEVRSALETGPNFVSRNRALTYITVQFRSDSEHAHVEAAQNLARKLSRLPNVKVGGSDLVTSQANSIINEDLRRAEILALPLLLVLLLWFFRGLIAAALPLILGGSAIVLTQAGLRIATDFIAISALVLAIVAALGIGLAIDYSLLIVSRFREELTRSPADVPGALERTMTTAGRTVLFSSLTVTAAFASLLLLPQPFFYSMGVGGSLVTMLVCLAALTILPAMLAWLGPRVNALAPARLQRSARALARPDLNGGWYRFAQLVMRRPLPVALGAAALLIAIAASTLGAKLIMPSMSTMPEFTSVRQVSNALSTKFKLEPNRVTEIVTVDATSRQLTDYRHELAHVPGVANTFPPEHLKRHVALMYVSSSYDPSSTAAQELVERIRALPTPFEAKVTGFTATFVDLKASLTRHLPMAALFIVLTTLLSIFLLTGSVVLPIKTLLMSALTASAAVGVLVLIYQHGFLHGITGFTHVGAVEITQMVALIAIVFGISTDYGVFTIDRIREMHSGGSSNREAIALGLERTGRITTTAALLLCVAVGSLITSRIIGAQEVSLGITVAVLLDATVVRALLVPALMCMLGELNWWCPAPLRRIHARVWASVSPQTPPVD